MAIKKPESDDSSSEKSFIPEGGDSENRFVPYATFSLGNEIFSILLINNNIT